MEKKLAPKICEVCERSFTPAVAWQVVCKNTVCRAAKKSETGWKYRGVTLTEFTCATCKKPFESDRKRELCAKCASASEREEGDTGPIRGYTANTIMTIVSDQMLGRTPERTAEALSRDPEDVKRFITLIEADGRAAKWRRILKNHQKEGGFY